MFYGKSLWRLASSWMIIYSDSAIRVTTLEHIFERSISLDVCGGIGDVSLASKWGRMANGVRQGFGVNIRKNVGKSGDKKSLANDEENINCRLKEARGGALRHNHNNNKHQPANQPNERMNERRNSQDDEKALKINFCAERRFSSSSLSSFLFFIRKMYTTRRQDDVAKDTSTCGKS